MAVSTAESGGASQTLSKHHQRSVQADKRAADSNLKRQGLIKSG